MPHGEQSHEVVGAAVVRHGRVLAARRAGPAAARGRWELPGGKVEPGESAAQAVAREVREELGCDVAHERPLAGRAPLGEGRELSAHLVRLVAGEPVPREHDAVRWLAVEELEDVAWLDADRVFLPQLRDELAAGERFAGGNVGGAARVGQTVRRATGPWTPAVHALLAHLAASGLDGVPQVLGVDDAGREVLEYLPGAVLESDDDRPDALVADAARWLHRYHRAVAGFAHPGPWRNGAGALAPGQIVCHHDFAPYNVATSSSATGPRVVGVFDWDLASPGVPLDDVAFAAWNWVPMWSPLPADEAARRIRLLADAYGGEVAAPQVAAAVVPRIERSLAVMRHGVEVGDPGFLALAARGLPELTARSLAALRDRMPLVLEALDAGTRPAISS